MSQIMKSFTAVFLVLFMGITAVGILGMYATVLHAQDTHAMIIEDLEDSNFYPTVVKQCFQSAAAKGYGLTLTMYEHSGNVMKCTSYLANGNYSEIEKARVELSFATTIPFLGMNWKQQLVGYAR